MAVPSSCVEMVPSPSLSNIANASLNSTTHRNALVGLVGLVGWLVWFGLVWFGLVWLVGWLIGLVGSLCVVLNPHVGFLVWLVDFGSL